MAGRLGAGAGGCLCLLWGMGTLLSSASASDSADDGTKKGGKKRATTTTPKQKKKAAIEKIRKAHTEIQYFLTTLGRLLALLPSRRFGMLLPRHVTDLYAALFQSERLHDLHRRFSSSGGTGNGVGSGGTDGSAEGVGDGDDCAGRDFRRMRDIFLSSDSDSSTATDNNNNNKNPNDPNNPPIYALDSHTRAHTYRHLLYSFGQQDKRITPPWFKKRLCHLLTSLALSTGGGGLRAVVDVFVREASSNNNDDVSSAAKRLGRVLSTVDTGFSRCSHAEGGSSNSGDNGREEYYCLLTKALVLLLSSPLSSPSSSNKDATAVDDGVIACVLTVWYLRCAVKKGNRDKR